MYETEIYLPETQHESYDIFARLEEGYYLILVPDTVDPDEIQPEDVARGQYEIIDFEPSGSVEPIDL